MINFLLQNFERHIQETLPLINQLTDELVYKKPINSGMEVGELILHMTRSFEYYSEGLSSNNWKSAPYSLKDYNTKFKIIELFNNVSKSSLKKLKLLTNTNLQEEMTFNRKSTKLEIFQELIEHSIQHRGQLLVYYRILDLIPSKISYII